MIIKGGYEKAKVYLETRTDAARNSQTSRTELRNGPCINISREAGSGSGIITEKLITDLQNMTRDENAKWSIFDKNLIEKILSDHDLPDRLFGFFTEEKKSKFSSMINELFGLQPPSALIIKQTSESILKIAHIGYVIIVGRGANIITSKLPNVINIRFVSPIEERIKRIHDVYGWDRKDSLEFIKNEDTNRKEFIFNTFHKQIDDPLSSHMVINTSLFNPNEISDILCHLVKSRFPEFFK